MLFYTMDIFSVQLFMNTCYVIFLICFSDPDITRGDGIYSRYAPPLDGPSRYAMTLTVDASSAVLALAHNPHLSSIGSSYSAYKTTGPSVYSEANTAEGSHYTSTSYTSSSSPAGRRNENPYQDPVDDNHPMSRQHEHKDLQPKYRSSESSRQSGRSNHGFVDSVDNLQSFRTSLHSIETQAESLSSISDYQTHPSVTGEGIRRGDATLDTARSVASVDQIELASIEEQSGARHRVLTRVKPHDNARHHRRRSVHDKEVSGDRSQHDGVTEFQINLISSVQFVTEVFVGSFLLTLYFIRLYGSVNVKIRLTFYKTNHIYPNT